MNNFRVTDVDLSTLEDTLPNTVHELLAVAMKDIREARHKKREIKLTGWMKVREEERACSVCLAGSILWNTYKLQQTLLTYWDDERKSNFATLPISLQLKFIVIDRCRLFGGGGPSAITHAISQLREHLNVPDIDNNFKRMLLDTFHYRRHPLYQARAAAATIISDATIVTTQEFRVFMKYLTELQKFLKAQGV